MADEKINVSPEESKTPEAPAPSGPGDTVCSKLLKCVSLFVSISNYSHFNNIINKILYCLTASL